MEPEVTARLRLKKGKERPLRQHHHWIYSGAVANLPKEALFAKVESHEGDCLGTAMLTPGRSIVGHMLAWGEETLEQALSRRIRSAYALRSKLFDPTITNAIRLIHAEGDGIPGLIADLYKDVLVLQVSHPAMETLKSLLVQLFVQEIAPHAIYEKSTSFLRKKEGLSEAKSLLWGQEKPIVEVVENGLRYKVDLVEGQKTGLFLDQRDMRSLVRTLSPGKRVLNCFAYTGGFSVAALAGGALHVDSIDSSKKCEPAALENLRLNQLSVEQHRFLTEDAIDFIVKNPLPYDLVILDPPAFVKKKEDIDTAFRAYKELNRVALQKMPSSSLLLTCSCSYHVSEELFQNILFRAALEANRKVRIIGRHRQAFDHPTSLFHPESEYLKSLLLWVE
jgi:23S rRNA (cytosine1962-C5)-methyltransferase